MNGIRIGLILLLSALILASACTLTIGGPSQLPDALAPTAIPLGGDPDSLAGVPGKSINLPPGFEINLFADGLEGPRMMTLGPDGHIYVAERGAGRILRLPDEDHDGKPDRADIVATSEAEISILEAYLPQPFSEAEIEKMAQEAIDEVGATSPGEMGKVMRVLMPRLQGRAEGSQVSQTVRQLLSEG